MPALLRLSALWIVQLWCLMTSSSSSDDYAVDEGLVAMADEPAGPVDVATGEVLNSDLTWSPTSFSVVLPCAGEGEYALRTVQSVFESLPLAQLKEIIVVDDGSSPPVSEAHLPPSLREKYRVRILRHESTVGLIGAKKDGGDVATGDIVVFFDCHVAPQPGWHQPFQRLIGENYRRIVVPMITDLDVDSWSEKSSWAGQAKCYLTWDADFKWYESEDNYVPILSGGLLGMSKRWWNETGGYDQHMSGWGGENLDQSLRTWLCGGEIVNAKEARVAHMWRVKSDPRTRAHYRVGMGAAQANRLRAAMAWYGDFVPKLRDFPDMNPDRKAWGGGPWYGDISNILEVKHRLKCRTFEWFMHRFKHVYVDGGLLPSETFAVKSAASGLCLTFTGSAGTSKDGSGKAVLKKCDPTNDRQRWHGANRDGSDPAKACCSGLRAWNTDQCITGLADGWKAGLSTSVCDIAGLSPDQQWSITEDGTLRTRGGGFMSNKCLEADATGVLRHHSCNPRAWEKIDASKPLETRLYDEALKLGRG